MKPIVHIRSDDTPWESLCGAHGESISTYHYMNHVLVNNHDCCEQLWLKLCRTCVERSLLSQPHG